MPVTAPLSSQNNSTVDASTQEMQTVFDAQLAMSLAWRTSTAAERIARIKKLRDAVLNHREAFYSAFHEDLRKPPSEVEATELLPLADEMRHAIGHLKRWMKPRSVWPGMLTLGTRAAVHLQSRGRVLIIAPWNYPLSLCFGPLVSALAAGNTVILKPSEMTPRVSALMSEIIAKVFSAHEVALFNGTQATSTALLSMPFDHIFFTGSPAVGKIVMTAAAQHLTSVTLELGGKSPTIVDASADLALTAQNLMWGKFLNNGQTCVAPDYVFVHDSIKAAFIDACKLSLTQLYGSTAADRQRSPDLTRVVNPRHTERLTRLLDDAIARGAQVLAGGDVVPGERYIAPTLLDCVPSDARIMQEEIFGPLLPITGYSDINRVIAEINAQPKPLALYIFSRDTAAVQHVLNNTSSGGACVNHCMVHFAHGGLPFGGVNHSGIGNSHGEYGFKAFSHERAVLRGTFIRTEKFFAPPFTPARIALIRKIVDLLRLPML
jgi:aldehyde dehydrogenase (NAD+)